MNATVPSRQTGSAATAIHRHLHRTQAVEQDQQHVAFASDSLQHNSVSTQTQEKEADDPFEFLKVFDTCFVIDDSVAMKPYWDEVTALVRAVIPFCTERDTNGIDIWFGNHTPAGALFGDVLRAGYRHIGLVTGHPQMHDNIEGIFNDVKPTGRHRITSRLLDLLDAYISKCRQSVNAPGGLKPFNIIVVTAQPLSERLPEKIRRIAKELDDMKAVSWQLGLQFFQVGDDEEARRQMRLLDDVLHTQSGVRDVVDTATWTDGPGKLSAEGVLKVVGGATWRAVDSMKLEELRMPDMPKGAW